MRSATCSYVVNTSRHRASTSTAAVPLWSARKPFTITLHLGARSTSAGTLPRSKSRPRIASHVKRFHDYDHSASIPTESMTIRYIFTTTSCYVLSHLKTPTDSERLSSASLTDIRKFWLPFTDTPATNFKSVVESSNEVGKLPVSIVARIKVWMSLHHNIAYFADACPSIMV